MAFDPTKPFEVTTKRERAAMGLALNQLATPKPSTLLREINFLFRGIRSIDNSTRKKYQEVYNKVCESDPALTSYQVHNLVFENKQFLAKFIRDRTRQSVYYQCVILQVSNWMKAVIKTSHGAIQEYAGKKYSLKIWKNEGLLKVGPDFKRSTWAAAMIAGSNYVRHFEEWDYEKYEVSEVGPRKLQFRRKHFLTTLKDKMARKNVQALIDAGVKEADLFGLLQSGSVSIMEAIDSETSSSLLENCERWQSAVNELTAQVVRNHPDNDDTNI